MTNSELLAYEGPSNLLTGLEKQTRYVLRAERGPFMCPHCGTLQSKWEIHGVGVDDYAINGQFGDHGQCKGCEKPLRYYVTLMGDSGLDTVPDLSLVLGRAA